MKLSQLLTGINAQTGLDGELEITGITADSRLAAPGMLFCCVKGMTRDGHDFAPGAAEAGASVLVQRDLGLEGQIIVPDVREAMSRICENFHHSPLADMKLIGVTGTNGKTSTTIILKQILEQLGHKVGLIGTISNMIGDEVIESAYTTPDTCELHALFARMRDAGCDVCVMEVSSFAIEQGRVAGITFDTACFTNLSQDHLDVHGTMEVYFEIKQRLFSMCRRAVVNIDDRWAQKLKMGQGVELTTFGVSPQADMRAENACFRPDGVTFDLCLGGERYSAHAVTPGSFSVHNAMSAVACALSVHDDAAACVEALGKASGVKGRAEVFPTGRDFTVVIDYAHSPDGVENILSAMREVSGGGRVVALLGCGGDRDNKKRPIMGETAARLADFVIVTSDNPRTEEPMAIIEQILPGVRQHDTPYVVIENRREAIRYAVEHAQSGDVIVLAGKGHETYQILNTGTIHFDEREVLAEIFSELSEGGENK